MQNTQPLATLTLHRQPRCYTLAEYLQREARSTALHEYYNGTIAKLPMAKGPHNIITMNVAAALKNALKAAEKKYVVLGGQQLVYLPELNYGLYPDVLVVMEAPEYWDKNQVLLTNPVLIVEVLSKSTRKYDKNEKFAEYKTLTSFAEYMLIEPEKCSITTHFREAPQLWRDAFFKEIASNVPLKSLEIDIAIADIYENVVLK
jgi:Uma2 family endonuclease